MGRGCFKMSKEFMESGLHDQLVDGLKGAVLFLEIIKEPNNCLKQMIEGPEICDGVMHSFVMNEDGTIEIE